MFGILVLILKILLLPGGLYLCPFFSATFPSSEAPKSLKSVLGFKQFGLWGFISLHAGFLERFRWVCRNTLMALLSCLLADR